MEKHLSRIKPHQVTVEHPEEQHTKEPTIDTDIANWGQAMNDNIKNNDEERGNGVQTLGEDEGEESYNKLLRQQLKEFEGECSWGSS